MVIKACQKNTTEGNAFLDYKMVLYADEVTFLVGIGYQYKELST